MATQTFLKAKQIEDITSVANTKDIENNDVMARFKQRMDQRMKERAAKNNQK
jgi:hypothetical protein